MMGGTDRTMAIDELGNELHIVRDGGGEPYKLILNDGDSGVVYFELTPESARLLAGKLVKWADNPEAPTL